MYTYISALKDFYDNISRPHNGVETGIVNAINMPAVQMSLRALGILGLRHRSMDSPSWQEAHHPGYEPSLPGGSHQGDCME